MPYSSDRQRRYFNANRKQLESEGVDVDEWNKSSKGKKLPEKAKSAEVLGKLAAEGGDAAVASRLAALEEELAGSTLGTEGVEAPAHMSPEQQERYSNQRMVDPSTETLLRSQNQLSQRNRRNIDHLGRQPGELVPMSPEAEAAAAAAIEEGQARNNTTAADALGATNWDRVAPSEHDRQSLNEPLPTEEVFEPRMDHGRRFGGSASNPEGSFVASGGGRDWGRDPAGAADVALPGDVTAEQWADVSSRYPHLRSDHKLELIRNENRQQSQNPVAEAPAQPTQPAQPAQPAQPEPPTQPVSVEEPTPDPVAEAAGAAAARPAPPPVPAAAQDAGVPDFGMGENMPELAPPPSLMGDRAGVESFGDINLGERVQPLGGPQMPPPPPQRVPAPDPSTLGIPDQPPPPQPVSRSGINPSPGSIPPPPPVQNISAVDENPFQQGQQGPGESAGMNELSRSTGGQMGQQAGQLASSGPSMAPRFSQNSQPGLPGGPGGSFGAGGFKFGAYIPQNVKRPHSTTPTTQNDVPDIPVVNTHDQGTVNGVGAKTAEELGKLAAEEEEKRTPREQKRERRHQKRKKLGPVQHAYVADAMGGKTFQRLGDKLTDTDREGNYDDLFSQWFTGMGPRYRQMGERIERGASRMADNPAWGLTAHLDPTAGEGSVGLIGMASGLGGGADKAQNAKRRAGEAYTKFIKEYQDKLRENTQGTTRPTPWHLNQQGQLANLDSDIAGHKYMRDRRPFHYWLNPLDKTGPMMELTDRAVRRVFAGGAEPDSTGGRLATGMAGLGTLGLYPLIMGGGDAQQKLRASAVDSGLYSPETQPEILSSKAAAVLGKMAAEKQALGGIGTLAGALAGPVSAGQGNRVEGLGRGVGRGLGWDIGGSLGSLLGGGAGVAAGGGLGALAALLYAAKTGNPYSRGQLARLIASGALSGGTVGAGVGAGAGYFGGGVLGYQGAGKVMGPASYQKKEKGNEAQSGS